jgi:hypothetical protein
MKQRVAATFLATLAFVALIAAGCGGSSGDRATQFIDVPGLGSTRVDVPRPTSEGSATCDDDPLPPASDATVEERVAALRDVGLFADRASLSDAALAAEVEAALVDTWGEVPKRDPVLDLMVAEQDRTRVWWRDLEADVIDGNEVYAQTLAEWSEISVGVFEPTDIAETWEGDQGPVTVSFTQGGTSRTLHPNYYDDFIDPGIIVGVNEAIAGADRRFEIHQPFDQSGFVMALTEAERQALEARGWCF